jgi:glycosyltransferase 2 family protein
MTKLLRLAVSVVLLAAIAWKVNWADVQNAFVHLRPEYGLAAVGLLLLSQLASAKRWHLFARELHFECSVRQLFVYYLIGMYFNLVLPTSVGGDVVRAWYLAGNARRRLAAFAAVFLERLNGLLVLIALACLATALSPLALPWWIPLCVWGIASGAVLGLAALPLLTRWSQLPLPRRHQLQTVLLALRAPRVLLLATLLSVFVQAANVVAVWLLGVALNAPVPAGYYWIMVPMVSLLTLLPVSLNGMGVREGGVLLFLAPLGVDEATALTLSFLWFAINSALSLLGGVVYLFGALPKPGAQALASEGESEHGSLGRDSDQGRERQLDQAA